MGKTNRPRSHLKRDLSVEALAGSLTDDTRVRVVPMGALV